MPAAARADAHVRAILRGAVVQPMRAGAVGDAVAQGGTIEANEAAATSMSRTVADVLRPPVNRTGLPDRLKAGVEGLSGFALDDVRVHYNSPLPARLQALAYTQAPAIHVAPGQERHLPHEAWHVVQQKQGRVKPTLQAKGVAINDEGGLEREADSMGARACDGAMHPRGAADECRGQALAPGRAVVQREVRTDGGKAKIAEADYLKGGSKERVGTSFSVAKLIKDKVKRVFSDVAELDDYAYGKTDYIGDVATKSAGTFWYRLPKDKLTVLGEEHSNPQGNVEDVILGLRTPRFMYESYNELTQVPGSPFDLGGTERRLEKVGSGQRVAALVKSKEFNPALENIVIKALAGAVSLRNEFIPGKPNTMDKKAQEQWRGRRSTREHSGGERVALYLSMGIHLAADISKHDLGREHSDQKHSDEKHSDQSPYVGSARNLKDCYLKNQPLLDAFMREKDADDLIGIYELTAPGNFKDLPVIAEFSRVFQDYASRYIEQLGAETGNVELKRWGTMLLGAPEIKSTGLYPVRELIMWEKILHAKANGYLLVGIGDAHRTGLAEKLHKEAISNKTVDKDLKAQRDEIGRNWVTTPWWMPWLLAGQSAPVRALLRGPVVQPKYAGEDGTQGKTEDGIGMRNAVADVLRPSPNRTGLPDRLKAGVEALSGFAMDDVRVHYNSPLPARLQALAYTQAPDIHVAPGQERHLPHEAWHVVQQKQGRVKPTLQAKGVAINDDGGLEREADVMGARARAVQDSKTSDALAAQLSSHAGASHFQTLGRGTGQPVFQLATATDLIAWCEAFADKIDASHWQDGGCIKDFQILIIRDQIVGGLKMDLEYHIHIPSVSGRSQDAWSGSLYEYKKINDGKATLQDSGKLGNILTAWKDDAKDAIIETPEYKGYQQERVLINQKNALKQKYFEAKALQQDSKKTDEEFVKAVYALVDTFQGGTAKTLPAPFINSQIKIIQTGAKTRQDFVKEKLLNPITDKYNAIRVNGVRNEPIDVATTTITTPVTTGAAGAATTTAGGTAAIAAAIVNTATIPANPKNQTSGKP